MEKARVLRSPVMRGVTVVWWVLLQLWSFHKATAKKPSRLSMQVRLDEGHLPGQVRYSGRVPHVRS